MRKRKHRHCGPWGRFFEKVLAESVSGCWNWTGALYDQGYGRFYLDGKIVPAHRYSWQIHFYEKVPDHLVVRHKCDNPRCVNPLHLELGTHADNVADMDARGRRCSGQNQPYARLRNEWVRAIRNDTRSHRVIAADYGVSHRTIGKIKNREKWANLS